VAVAVGRERVLVVGAGADRRQVARRLAQRVDLGGATRGLDLLVRGASVLALRRVFADPGLVLGL